MNPTSKIRKTTTLAAALCSLFTLWHAALPASSESSEKIAAETERNDAPLNENQSESSNDAAQGSPLSTRLEGGVRGSAVRLEEGLLMIEASARMVQGSALELAKECTRKETAVMRGPNYIGNGIVIPAIGNPNGTVQIGELPARKDRVESFLSSAEESVKALRSHVDGLIMPEASPENMFNLWRGMQSTMQVAENNINSMRELVAQTPSKKGEIKQKDAKPLGRAALKVYDSMTALEKMRSQLDDIVKPQLKKKG